MPRHEFSRKTKREALHRSNLLCEAVGEFYGLESGIRCNISLSKGVQFDHIVADALGGDNSLENCAAVCLRCHSEKSRKNDTPKAAKVKRVSDKALGITGPKKKIQSAGFPKRERPERPKKPVLPPSPLYK